MPQFGSQIMTGSGAVQSHIFEHEDSPKFWGYVFQENSVAVKMANYEWMVEEENGNLRPWYPAVSYSESEGKIHSLIQGEYH